MLQTIVTCEMCKTKSVTSDPFIVLSLPAHFPTVAQSLVHFLKEEPLLTYFCTNCQQHSEVASLKVQIAKAPKILILQLKRF